MMVEGDFRYFTAHGWTTGAMEESVSLGLVGTSIYVYDDEAPSGASKAPSRFRWPYKSSDVQAIAQSHGPDLPVSRRRKA